MDKRKREYKMKKIKLTATILSLSLLLTACNEANRVNENISNEADHFNVARKLTVINAIQGETLFEVTGVMSINHQMPQGSNGGGQLEIITKEKGDKFKKHMIGLSDNTTYVIEDITGSNVNTDQYTIRINPKAVIPDVKLDK